MAAKSVQVINLLVWFASFRRFAAAAESQKSRCLTWIFICILHAFSFIWQADWYSLRSDPHSSSLFSRSVESQLMCEQSQYAISSNEMRFSSTFSSSIGDRPFDCWPSGRPTDLAASLFVWLRSLWSSLQMELNRHFSLRHSWLRCLRCRALCWRAAWFLGLWCGCLRLWWWLRFVWLPWWRPCEVPLEWWLLPWWTELPGFEFFTLLSSSADCCLKIRLNSSSSSLIRRTPASTLSSLWPPVWLYFLVEPNSHSPKCTMLSSICWVRGKG